MLLLLSCLVILPSARAFVDCGLACKHCRNEMHDLPMWEVYCAMCRECRGRRRERRDMEEMKDKEYGWDPQEQQEPPPGCPTPPDCDSSIEILNKDVPTTQATTCMPATIATTCMPVATTTTARTCPPIIPCRDRKKMTERITERMTERTPPSTTPLPPKYMPYMPCMPCMPMCPCPASPVVPLTASEFPSPPTTLRDFFYLYIGFPKGVLNKADD